jgi:XRE family aerobic/anaerobic benzoate catabolism transcriptional regulator
VRTWAVGVLYTAPMDRPRRAPRATAPPDLLQVVSRRTRQLRQTRGLTLRGLANRSGLSLRFLMEVEGGRGNISIRRLADLAEALGATPAELLTTPAGDTGAVIALLGLRGAGKTTVGRRLAKRLRVRFVELDREIETRAGLALDEVFTLHGEEYYRRLEHDTLVDLLASPGDMVLAVGGGLVTSAETYALLRRRARTVWLRARPEDYWARVVRQGDRRPMNQHPQAEDALRRLVDRREPLYAKADLTVDTSSLPAAAVVARLERALAQT